MLNVGVNVLSAYTGLPSVTPQEAMFVLVFFMSSYSYKYKNVIVVQAGSNCLTRGSHHCLRRNVLVVAERKAGGQHLHSKGLAIKMVTGTQNKRNNHQDSLKQVPDWILLLRLQCSCGAEWWNLERRAHETRQKTRSKTSGIDLGSKHLHLIIVRRCDIRDRISPWEVMKAGR